MFEMNQLITLKTRYPQLNGYSVTTAVGLLDLVMHKINPAADSNWIRDQIASIQSEQDQHLKLKCVSDVMRELICAPITITLDSGHTAKFDADDDSQLNIIRAIPVFAILESADIQAGASGKLWVLADNSMVIVTKSDLQRVYEVGSLRKNTIIQKARVTKDLLLSGQPVPQELCDLFGI